MNRPRHGEARQPEAADLIAAQANLRHVPVYSVIVLCSGDVEGRTSEVGESRN